MLYCFKCGHSWYRRTPNGPRRCPYCKSLKWRLKEGELTQERVKELFNYHPDGYLTWKIKYHPSIEIGAKAGSPKSNGYSYWRIGIDGKNYSMHRIIWLWHYGYIPENLIDHIDRDTSNSKIENLREVSNQCNIRNSKVRSDSNTGITGVYKYPDENKWLSYISVNGKRKHIGVFYNLDEAVKARHNEELKLNWEGCNSTSSAYLYLVNRRLL